MVLSAVVAVVAAVLMPVGDAALQGLPRLTSDSGSGVEGVTVPEHPQGAASTPTSSRTSRSPTPAPG